jgi:tetratricopeptide (TPR) repeat protein
VLELNDQQLILPANMALANVDLVLGNADQAERIARQIKKGYPESSNGFMLQGDVLMSKNMAKDAVEAYKLALSKSQDGVVINKLYEAYNASGETEKGLELLRNWLNSNPEDLSTRVSYAQALQKGGKTAQAISEFGEVVRMDPNNLLALNNLSMLYLRNNDRKYLDTSRKAYQLAPDNPAIIDTYGWALVKSGSLEQGLALIERAATESRDDYDIRYHLAAALAERGNIARARTELEKIISDNRQFAEKKAASDLLKEIQK